MRSGGTRCSGDGGGGGSGGDDDADETTAKEKIERLRMLVPLLPTEEERQTLRNYTGKRDELGAAEQFLLKLLAVPDYALRIESILLRDEFAAFALTVDGELRTLIAACRGETSDGGERRALARFDAAAFSRALQSCSTVATCDRYFSFCCISEIT